MNNHIGLMGPIVVTRHGEDVTPSQPKLRQLLALLALQDGAAVSSENIARELWGTTPPQHYSHIVQTYVSQLRGVLGGSRAAEPARIRNVPRVGYHLTLDEHTGCDVDRVQLLVARSTARLTDGDTDAALSDIEQAHGLCRGRPLSGVPLGPMLHRRRKRLEALRIACFEQALRLSLDCGRLETAIGYHDRVVAEDAKHENLYALLLTALGRAGRTSTAVDLFHDVRRDIVARTGMEPGHVLNQAYLAVVQNSGATAHDGPTARPWPTGRPTPAQLPFAPTTFIGFTAELAAARGVLTRQTGTTGGAAVMVVGGPGSGKTTFCTQLAHDVRGRYPGGQLHADLATGTVADALRDFVIALGSHPDAVPDSVVERSRLFRRMTAHQPLLVVVDNVIDVHEVRWLQPGSNQAAMILACRRRCWAEFITGTVELRGATTDELMAMLVARIGAEAVAREPAAARSVVALAFGLPVAITSLTTLLRSRPHWTLQRLVERLTGDMGNRIELALGSERLATIVESTLRLITPATRDALLQACQHTGCHTPFTTASLARITGLRLEDAEQVIEDAVAVRIADPVVHHGRQGYYTLNAIYRAAALEWYRRWPSLRADTAATEAASA